MKCIKTDRQLATRELSICNHGGVIIVYPIIGTSANDARHDKHDSVTNPITNASAMTSLLSTLRGLLVMMFLNHTGLDLVRRDRLGISGFEEGCNRNRRRLIAFYGGSFLQCVEVGQPLHLGFARNHRQICKKLFGHWIKSKHCRESSPPVGENRLSLLPGTKYERSSHTVEFESRENSARVFLDVTWKRQEGVDVPQVRLVSAAKCSAVTVVSCIHADGPVTC